MPTLEIPRDQWVSFFDSFSGKHDGWLVTVEVIGPDVGDQKEAKELPLVGINADLKDNEDFVNITVGRLPKDRMMHTVADAARVWLKQSNEGADEALEIESRDGTKTLVTFRAAVLPDSLDGITTDEQVSAGRKRK
jgi:hypothetical protein